MHRSRLDALPPVPRRLGARATPRRSLAVALVVVGLSAVAVPVALAAPTTGGASADDAGSVRVPRVLERIAECESGGDPRAVSADGRYRGKYQFSRDTWRGLGGSGDPAAAPERLQDRLAVELFRRRGTEPWPECGRKATGDDPEDD